MVPNYPHTNLFNTSRSSYKFHPLDGTGDKCSAAKFHTSTPSHAQGRARLREQIRSPHSSELCCLYVCCELPDILQALALLLTCCKPRERGKQSFLKICKSLCPAPTSTSSPTRERSIESQEPQPCTLRLLMNTFSVDNYRDWDIEST